MLTGLEKFREHFRGHENMYILIGGTACHELMREAALEFRSTKDMDIVLCVEILTREFFEVFWDFIKKGGYEISEKASGEKCFYRFRKPTDHTFPEMLEVFSNNPEIIEANDANAGHIVPLAIQDEIISLSAILLNEDYYGFIINRAKQIDGLSVIDEYGVIPLKARAFLDLYDQKLAGGKIDSKDIKKHKRDVFRIAPLLVISPIKEVPPSIKEDMQRFLEMMKREDPKEFKAAGIMEDILVTIPKLRVVYGLDED